MPDVVCFSQVKPPNPTKSALSFLLAAQQPHFNFYDDKSNHYITRLQAYWMTKTFQVNIQMLCAVVMVGQVSNSKPFNSASLSDTLDIGS